MVFFLNLFQGQIENKHLLGVGWTGKTLRDRQPVTAKQKFLQSSEPLNDATLQLAVITPFNT